MSRTRYKTDASVAAAATISVDDSGGVAADPIAAITNANNVGSADVLPTSAAIAQLHVDIAAVKTELAAVRAKLGF